MKPFPVRRVLAIVITAICIYLAISNHYNAISQHPDDNFGFGAPAPPDGAFPEAFLIAPGAIVVLPILMTASLFEPELLLTIALIISAAFFWYCVGWVIDCALGSTTCDAPPKFVTRYLRVLSIVCVGLFPFGILKGMYVGTYFCANGKPPYWSELLMYGIAMFWISLGASSELLRFLQSRQVEHQRLNIDCI
jgi:hypothetical protein